MSNYDFGYEIQNGSTMEWAINVVKNDSEVLELGPAIGTLTKHLTEDKNCKVDIVEIDEEAGKRALRFARNGCIGICNGNLETDVWYEKYKDNKYDYIIILDVLEHLKNVQELLERLKTILKDDGEIVLSLPNVAHNSVAIELLCNKFHYTKVGLLDETHLHFYTYETICDLLEKNGFNIIEKNAHQLRVGENEIKNSYEDIPSSVAAFLRTREYADVYQFLFRIKKGECSNTTDKFEIKNLPYTLYQFIVLNSKTEVIWRDFINPIDELSVEFTTSKEEDVIRITPLNDFCIIKNLTIKGYDLEENEIELKVQQTTAAIADGEYAFMDQDPQLFVKKPDEIIKIKVNGEFLSYGDSNVKYILPFWKEILEQRVIINDYKKIV